MLKRNFGQIQLSSKNFLILIIVLLPVLGSYSIGIRGITFGDVSLLVAEVMCIPYVLQLKRTRPIVLYMMMFLCMFGMTILSFGMQGNVYLNAATRMVRMLFYAVSIIFATSVVEYPKIKRIYMAVCCVLCLYMFLQFALFVFAGILLPNKILPLGWYASSRASNIELAELYSTYYYRGAGFFEEPSFAGLYLIPGYCMTLYEEKNRRKILKFVMLACSVIVTTSLTAILIMAVCTFLYYCKTILSKLTTKNFIGLLGIMLAAIFALAVINQTAFGANFNYRVSHMLTLRGGSTSMRLFRGYGVWGSIEPEYKVLGIGAGSLDNYVSEHHIVTEYDSSEVTDDALAFANALSLVLLYGGIFTFIIFLCLIFYLFRYMKREMRLILCFAMLMFASAGGIFDSDSVFYWSLIFAGFHFQRV